MGRTTAVKRAIQLQQQVIDQHLKLVQMADPLKIDFCVDGDYQYLVHFKDPAVFGMEFSILNKGDNIRTMGAKGLKTDSYFVADTQLRNFVQAVEGQATTQMMTSAGTSGAGSPTVSTPPIVIPPTVCTGPIVIPPTRWQDNG